MYEFLAPWGALAPALSALLIYLIVSEMRRKRMLHFIEPPEGPLVPVHWSSEDKKVARSVLVLN